MPVVANAAAPAPLRLSPQQLLTAANASKKPYRTDSFSKLSSQMVTDARRRPSMNYATASFPARREHVLRKRTRRRSEPYRVSLSSTLRKDYKRHRHRWKTAVRPGRFNNLIRCETFQGAGVANLRAIIQWLFPKSFIDRSQVDFFRSAAGIF